MRFCALTAILIAALSLAGCGLFYQAHTEVRAHRMLNNLQPGQTVTEVRDKWGEPEIRTDIPHGQVWSYAERANTNDVVATLIYTNAKEGDDGRFLDLKFIDGKLISWAEADHTMPAKEKQNFKMGIGNPAGGGVHF